MSNHQSPYTSLKYPTKQKRKRKTEMYVIKKKRVVGKTESRRQERKVYYVNFPWDETDAKVRRYLFLCLGAESQRIEQQKRTSLHLQVSKNKSTLKKLMTIREDIFRVRTFERYIFICRKPKKNETLQNFHAVLV